MNQMVNQIMGNQGQSNPYVQAWNMIKACKNPQQALINALGQSKNGPDIITILKNCNGNPQKAFYEYARVTGTDGDQLVQQLQNMGLK